MLMEYADLSGDERREKTRKEKEKKVKKSWRVICPHETTFFDYRFPTYEGVAHWMKSMGGGMTRKTSWGRYENAKGMSKIFVIFL
jgi:hypothetical protein